jgi:hypothetical protein
MLVVQVTPEILQRIDKLTPRMRRNASVTAVGRVTRSAVARLALVRGLDILEDEYPR